MKTYAKEVTWTHNNNRRKCEAPLEDCGGCKDVMDMNGKGRSRMEGNAACTQRD